MDNTSYTPKTSYFVPTKTGFNRVARGKITEHHTRGVQSDIHANDVLFRACKLRFQPAPPYQALAQQRAVGHVLDARGTGRAVLEPHRVPGASTRPLLSST